MKDYFLTRNEIDKIFNATEIDKALDAANFDFTNRVSPDLDCANVYEFFAYLGQMKSKDGKRLYEVRAYYYQDIDECDAYDELDQLDWDACDDFEITEYEV